jgi:hypothetical protein
VAEDFLVLVVFLAVFLVDLVVLVVSPIIGLLATTRSSWLLSCAM